VLYGGGGRPGTASKLGISEKKLCCMAVAGRQEQRPSLDCEGGRGKARVSSVRKKVAGSALCSLAGSHVCPFVGCSIDVYLVRRTGAGGGAHGMDAAVGQDLEDAGGYRVFPAERSLVAQDFVSCSVLAGLVSSQMIWGRARWRSDWALEILDSMG